MSKEDWEKFYGDEEIVKLLESAERLGFSLEAGSELEKLSLADLERLVNTRQ